MPEYENSRHVGGKHNRAPPIPPKFSSMERGIVVQERNGSAGNPASNSNGSLTDNSRRHIRKNYSDSASQTPRIERKIGDRQEAAPMRPHPQQSRNHSGKCDEPTGLKYSRSPPSQHTEQIAFSSLSVEQLETYAIFRSQDVTQNIHECIRIMEDTTGVATGTMETLHYQGGDIEDIHMRTVKVNHTLILGESLLGKLGGLFSRRWKPKKGPQVKGPQLALNSRPRKAVPGDRAQLLLRCHAVPRDQFGANPETFEGLSDAQLQLKIEREYQDKALSNLGNMVCKLKAMSVEMNAEVEQQTTALGHIEEDMDILLDRVKQAYNRTRYVVGR